MFKAIVSVCALALMIQSSAAACLGAGLAAPYGLAGSYSGFGAYDGLGLYGAYDGFGAYGAFDGIGAYGAYEPRALAASNGGGLEVASASIYPSGVSVLSENAIEGPLAVTGALPFLGTVALEGALPTAGAGAVNYGCGNGAVAILAEEIAPAGIAGPLGYGIGAWGAEAYGNGPYGYGIGGFAGPFRAGCGRGALI
ncbi:unnamed protein product [Euphydryas editha]|uniref:Uncharacterized protein n=1 Tax=Euphydryas editha TaxID=104508 RepID=A0AAU9TAV3_EUPED|nr:unnamed protein product [Euphydryas editha]